MNDIMMFLKKVQTHGIDINATLAALESEKAAIVYESEDDFGAAEFEAELDALTRAVEIGDVHDIAQVASELCLTHVIQFYPTKSDWFARQIIGVWVDDAHRKLDELETNEVEVGFVHNGQASESDVDALVCAIEDADNSGVEYSSRRVYNGWVVTALSGGKQ